jgi:hypothetical protein
VNIQTTDNAVSEITDYHRTLVDEALWLRGRIVASYSQVEFLLADIAVKLDLRFPYLIKDRIKAVKRIAERPGYEIYKTELEMVCDDLLRYDEIRTFMAHGFMRVDFDKLGNHRFELLRYQREAEGKYTLLSATTDIARLRDAAEHITDYVSGVHNLFVRIYRENKLEPAELTTDPRA